MNYSLSSALKLLCGFKRNIILLLILLSSFQIFAQNCTVNAGGNVTICGTTTTLTGTVTGILGTGSPTWSFVSGPIAPTIVTPNSLITNVTGMTLDGAYVFQLSKLCGSGTSVDIVTIVAHPEPPSFTAGLDVTTICATVGTTSLSGVIPAGYTGSWSSVNIYYENRFATSVSTNSTFSSTTIANPTFSLINKNDHEIDPAYYAILTITSSDGACTYADTAIVSFCPNPALIPNSPYEFCGSGTIYLYMDSNSPNMASDPDYGGAGQTPGVTYTVNTVSKPGGAGTLTFDEIDGDLVYLSGFTVVGTYVFSITINSPCCGSATTSDITVVISPPSPSNVDYSASGLHTEQMSLYSYGGSGGEVHCGLADIGTPEMFYFDINPIDLPSTVTTVTSGGILPPGASMPIITEFGAGTMNRSVSIDPGISGWKVGTYMFYVIVGTNPCEIVNSYYIHIADQNRSDVSIPDQSICYPGSGTVSVTVNQPAVFQEAVNSSYFQDFGGYWNYTVISKPVGSGTPVFDSYSDRELTDATTVIGNLTMPGDYIFTITPYNGGGAGAFIESEYTCSGFAGSLVDTFVVHVEDKINANAGSNQSLGCTSSIFLLGNSPGTGTGLWTNVSSPIGSIPTIPTPNSPSTIPYDLDLAGLYTFNWAITSLYGSCFSSANITFNISNASPPAPTFNDPSDVTHPSCALATGSVLLGNLPSSGTWTVTASPGGLTMTGTGSTGLFSGLPAGTYTFIVNDGVCNSLASASVTINPQPSIPSPPLTTAVSYCQNDVALSLIALATSGNTLNWYGTNAIGGIGSSTDPIPNTSITGVTTYYVSQINTITGCESVRSTLDVTINTLPLASISGTTTICENDASPVVTFTGSTSTSPYIFTYTINGGGNLTITSVGNTATISVPTTPAGSYNYDLVSIQDASTLSCTNMQSGLVSIIIDPIPTSPIIGTIAQPTCTIATGSVDLSGLPSLGTWTITESVNGTMITGTGTTATFSGLLPNNYTFSVTNSSGCTSNASSNAVVIAQPSTPTIPIVGTIIQPTCAVATGSVELSGLPSTGTWTITESIGATAMTGIGSDATFSGLITNTYTFTVTNDLGCISGSSVNAIIDPQPLVPSLPAVLNVVQPTCAVPTGSIEFISQFGVNYSIGGSFQSTSIFTNLIAGSYVLIVQDAVDNTCTSTSLIPVILSTPIPPTIVLSSIDPYSCGGSDGQITISGLDPNTVYDVEYFINSSSLQQQFGTITNSSGQIVISNLIAASYDNFTLTLLACYSFSSGVILVDPPAPSVSSINSVLACDTYQLPVISGTNLSGNQAYYTGVNGTGTIYNEGDIISTSGVIYLYDLSGFCSDEQSFTITINTTDDAGFTLTDYCENEPNGGVITGSTGGAFQFNPDLIDGAIINSATGEISNGVAGTSYSVEYTTSGACPSSSIETVMVNSIPAAPTVGPNATYCSTETPDLLISSSSGGTISWYSDSELSEFIGAGDSLQPLNITETYYAVETVNGCTSSPSPVMITIDNCEIIIPTAFTPDNDEVNDTWVLEKIDETFPNNIVRIYNRWGVLIFESPQGSYESNSWDGRYDGKVLPVQSFYYIIEYNDNKTEASKGTVSIILLK